LVAVPLKFIKILNKITIKFCDYTKKKSPGNLKTQFAAANQNPKQYGAFISNFKSTVDPFGFRREERFGNFFTRNPSPVTFKQHGIIINIVILVIGNIKCRTPG